MMMTEALEFLLIFKKAIIYISIVTVVIMLLNIPIYIASRLFDYRKLEWSKERLSEEMKKPLIIRMGILLVVSVILMMFYWPIDLLDKKTDYNDVMYYEVEPYSDNKSFEKELNDEDSLEILSLLEDVKCRRSLSSGHLNIDYPTVFLEISGGKNQDKKTMHMIITDHSTFKVTGMNVDYLYIADTEELDLYHSILNIVDLGN